MTDESWRSHLLVTHVQIDALLAATRRVVVLGIKPETHADQPAHYVAAAVKAAGLAVVPVPVLMLRLEREAVLEFRAMGVTAATRFACAG